MTTRESYAHFGAMLRDYRESFGDRAHERDPRIPRGVKLSAAGLVDSLGDANYPISPSTLSEIESGTSITLRGGEFIKAVCEVLYLDVPGPEWRALTLQLARDVVRARLGQEIANLAIPDVWS